MNNQCANCSAKSDCNEKPNNELCKFRRELIERGDFQTLHYMVAVNELEEALKIAVFRLLERDGITPSDAYAPEFREYKVKLLEEARRKLQRKS